MYNFVKNPSIILVGEDKALDRKLALNIINNLDYLSFGFIFTKNKDAYLNYTGVSLCYNTVTDELLKHILTYQINMINDNDNSNIFIIFDNVKLDEKSETVRECLMNGRHYHITYIIIQDNYTHYPPDLMINFDYMIFTDTPSDKIDLIYDFCCYGFFDGSNDILKYVQANKALIFDIHSDSENKISGVEYCTDKNCCSKQFEHIRTNINFLKFYDIFLSEETRQSKINDNYVPPIEVLDLH